MAAASDPARPIQLLGIAFLAGILIETALGVILGAALDPILESDRATSLAVILFVCGVANVVIWRLVLLPLQEKAGAPLASVASLGYAFIDAPGVYGLVAAILAGEGLVALPFGAVALGGWFLVRHELTLTAPAPVEDFPAL